MLASKQAIKTKPDRVVQTEVAKFGNCKYCRTESTNIGGKNDVNFHFKLNEAAIRLTRVQKSTETLGYLVKQSF